MCACHQTEITGIPAIQYFIDISLTFITVIFKNVVDLQLV